MSEADDPHGAYPFCVADESGRVLRVGNVPYASWIPPQVSRPGEQAAGGVADPSTDYVSGGAIVPRPANPATLVGFHLANLPQPCTISIDGTAYPCTDATCDLTFPHPGTYTVTVTTWPTLNAVFTVTQP
jgi:hypothetical protein